MTDIDWRARAEAARKRMTNPVTGLVYRLRNAAYRHGKIDTEDRWSDAKYREVDEDASKACEAVVEKIEELQKELAAAREDSARLEWMIEHNHAVVVHDGGYRLCGYLGGIDEWEEFGRWFTDPRAAIDEARSK